MSDPLPYEADTDDALLKNLMALGEPDDVIEEEDVEVGQELFELFLEGKLEGEDRQQFLDYLDANPRARAATSEYLSFLEEEEAASAGTIGLASASRSAWSTPARWSTFAVAMAACLLLAVTVPFFGGGGQVAENQAYQNAAALVASANFSKAEAAIQAARAEGIESPRLQLLAARAAMQQPNELTSPAAWSLREFDFEYDGTLVMDAEVEPDQVQRLNRAEAIVQAIDPAEQLARITQGWLLLKGNQAEAAAEVFQSVVEGQPENHAALMGLGVAEFMAGGDRLVAAEAAFRQFLEFEPNSLSGQLNLAMCLSEAGKLGEAVAQWRKIDLNKLPAEERAAAERAIADLQRGLEAQE